MVQVVASLVLFVLFVFHKLIVEDGVVDQYTIEAEVVGEEASRNELIEEVAGDEEDFGCCLGGFN